MHAILGISAYYHDSAAALVVDGRIVAAAQEERFTRQKHDASFPAAAIRACLRQAGLRVSDLACVVFYDKPWVKFERLLETYLAFAPRGFRSFLTAMPVWIGEKAHLSRVLRRELAALEPGTPSPTLLFGEHHESHAASAFYPSPYPRAAVLCLDGVGEWATGSVWLGDGNTLEAKWEMRFPHSLGLLYSAFTYHAGFKVNSGEYKLMGLAPYGEPRYVDTIFRHLIDLKNDGTFRLDMAYFDFATGLTMTNRRFDALFGGPPRAPESPLTQREMDLARSVQVVTEEIVLRLAGTIHRELGVDALCMAGGVALNCVSNGRLLREGPFRHIWVQPAAGDAGGAIGAALNVWHRYLGKARPVPGDGRDSMSGAYLGPRNDDADVQAFAASRGLPHYRFDDAELLAEVAARLAAGEVVGWVQGPMEFGPRALGNRSILGDARSPKMQQTMNLKIKFRESFRPFAPAVKREAVSDWFDFDGDSPYMLMVADVAKGRCQAMTPADAALFGIDQLNVARSEIPAVTHIDYSARLQTVSRDTNPRFWALLDAFEGLTGCPVLINTSFNVRGEPIVMTTEDAYRCFMRTGIDALVVENHLFVKSEQPSLLGDGAWRSEFVLD
ncbi:MAG: carbamoyltransferase [Myxococcales bacterium]|nr:carbamoyltransferase [Myxococcales bacterium]